VLTPLQRQLIELVASLPEAAPFALAGGAALIGRGEVARTTEDLDYFAADREAVAALAAALEAALREAALDVEVVQAAEGFVRMQVARGDERCQIDLAHDTRIREPEPTQVGTTVALEELAADKVLALFSRAEARDFVDVRQLVERFGWPRLLDLAAEKDLGFDVEHLIMALDAFSRLGAAEFPLTEEDHGELGDQVKVWRAELQQLESKAGGNTT
jgi:hypothetical protein